MTEVNQSNSRQFNQDHNSVNNNSINSSLLQLNSISVQKNQSKIAAQQSGKQKATTQKQKDKEISFDSQLSIAIQEAANPNYNLLVQQHKGAIISNIGYASRKQNQQSNICEINFDKNLQQSQASKMQQIVQQDQSLSGMSFQIIYQNHLLQSIENIQDQASLNLIIKKLQEMQLYNEQKQKRYYQMKKADQHFKKELQCSADEAEFKIIHGKYRKYKQLYIKETETSKKLKAQLRKIYDKVNSLE